jgi:hypothetical protein
MTEAELILRAIDKLSSDTSESFKAIREHLAELNGRTRKNSEAIAVLDERTADMVCAEHSATFRALESSVRELRDAGRPSRVSAAVTSGGVAGLMIVLQGVYQWWSAR